MEYQKIFFSENAANQPTKFRTNNWFEINDDCRGENKSNSQIKFKSPILRTSLCDYSNA